MIQSSNLIYPEAIGLGGGSAAVYREPAIAGSNPLQGTWILTESGSNGQPADGLLGGRLHFGEKHFFIQSRDASRVYCGTFLLDTDRKSSSIDFAHSMGKLHGTVWKGIYEVEGDTLRICANALDPARGRPGEFGAPAGSGRVSLTFRRTGSIPGDDELKAVKKSMAELNEAFNSRDVAAIKRLTTAGHWAMTTYNPTPMGLCESICVLPMVDIAKCFPDTQTVIPLSDRAALVTMSATVNGTFAGRRIWPRYLAAAMWVNRAGRWVEATYQETPILTLPGKNPADESPRKSEDTKAKSSRANVNPAMANANRVGLKNEAAPEVIKGRFIRLGEAFQEKDADAIRRLTTLDHLAVTNYNPAPMRLDKAISLLSDYNVEQFDSGVPQVEMLDEETAIVTFTVKVRAKFRGKQVPPRYFASAVWTRRDGQWLEAFYQETPLAE